MKQEMENWGGARVTRRWILTRLPLYLAFVGLLKGDTDQSELESMAWPTDPERILERIEQLSFRPGSHLRTTIVPRKIMWELVQVRKLQGIWDARMDESDWMAETTLFDQAIATLSTAGIRGGRLSVYPFELTEDGRHYNWDPLDTAIEIMTSHHMRVDLSAGPVHFPYAPGIRLPIQLQQGLTEAMARKPDRHMRVTLEGGDSGEVEQAILDFSFNFLEKMLERYGADPRIDTIYVGNEWRDTQGVEGTNITLSFDAALRDSLIDRAVGLTTKTIALNTNIHPLHSNELEEEFAHFFEILGTRAKLGLDTYPTREMEVPRLREVIPRYTQMTERIRDLFPQGQLVFTEYQAEPWPPEGVTGDSWVALYRNHPEVITGFYHQAFPRTLESHLIASGITEVGLWGAPAMVALATQGYDFPLRMVEAMAQAMER